MKLVYIAGPFSAPSRAGIEENIKRAVAHGLEVARIGAFPVIPHANTAHPEFEHAQPYTFWIDGTLELLRRCDAVLLVDGWQHSVGASGERDEAIKLGLPVFESLGELRFWLGGVS